MFSLRLDWDTRLTHTVSLLNWRNLNIFWSYELEIRFYPNFWGQWIFIHYCLIGEANACLDSFINSTWLHWLQIVRYSGETGVGILVLIIHPLEQRYKPIYSYSNGIVLETGEKEFWAVFESKPSTRHSSKYLQRWRPAIA